MSITASPLLVFVLQSKEIGLQMHEELLKVTNELYTVSRELVPPFLASRAQRADLRSLCPACPSPTSSGRVWLLLGWWQCWRIPSSARPRLGHAAPGHGWDVWGDPG